jgi:hypothetical protein
VLIALTSLLTRLPRIGRGNRASRVRSLRRLRSHRPHDRNGDQRVASTSTGGRALCDEVDRQLGGLARHPLVAFAIASSEAAPMTKAITERGTRARAASLLLSDCSSAEVRAPARRRRCFPPGVEHPLWRESRCFARANVKLPRVCRDRRSSKHDQIVRTHGPCRGSL